MYVPYSFKTCNMNALFNNKWCQEQSRRGQCPSPQSLTLAHEFSVLQSGLHCKPRRGFHCKQIKLMACCLPTPHFKTRSPWLQQNWCEQPFEALDLFGDNVTGPSPFPLQKMVFIETSDGLRIKYNTYMLKGARVNALSVHWCQFQHLMVNHFFFTVIYKLRNVFSMCVDLEIRRRHNGEFVLLLHFKDDHLRSVFLSVIWGLRKGYPSQIEFRCILHWQMTS